MATVKTKGKRKGPPYRSRTRKQVNNTTVSKVTRKKKRASDSESLLPKQLRGALEKQNVVKEKFGDASLEANPHTQRTLGLYVPSQVHTTVTKTAASTLHARSRAVAQKDARDTSKARTLLCAQFPAMPAETLEKVLGHAFLKGSRRVGRSGTVASEQAKVGLAVDAHIRHEHTEYERLLGDGVERAEARERVWGLVRRIRALWEGKGDVSAEAEATAISRGMKKQGKVVARNGRVKP
ncbi:conserved hypothetical protein [Histoplasma capsulatum H143]|uniref:DUF2293 domain-containing protein n=1 Tax=Ajellomyces capsulatus (strain H143) TaxID=544712 RepID=C6HN95_AJECH|nr:conserved hypothetical protein [Histoplasma capsulatum H143]